MATTYQITVATGSVEDAGTDANVYITLFGTASDSGERLLDNAANNFERGSLDVFGLEMQDIGDIIRIRIRHDNSNKYSGWFLSSIVVHNEQTDKEYVFPCGRWLAYDEDDGKIDRILDPK
jgi:hypothetical protein